MRITDIIRGILDQVDQAVKQQVQPLEPAELPPTAVTVFPSTEQATQEPDLVAIIQQLASLPTTQEPEYANAPQEMTAPIGASFPSGDDVHSRKNPADIRTNAPSMYPGYQAEKR